MPQGDPPVYIGTKKYISRNPLLKINFCKQNNDSIFLQEFIPSPAMQGLWRVPRAPQPVPMGLMGIDRIFINIDELQTEAANMTTPPPMDEHALQELRRLAADIQANGVSPEKMRRIQEIQNGTVKPVADAAMKVGGYKFGLTPQNYNTVIIDQTFKAAQINPQLAQTIVYGNFTVKLEAVQ
ncbi:hypothetical protein BH09BAC2_BH09BAC2_02050 [soil metagenome]